MSVHEERTERKVTCDRCRKDITGITPKIAQTGRIIREVTQERRFIRKVVLTNGRLTGKPRVLQCEIDFCDECWWEFDRLFCQGQAIPLADGVREQPSAALERLRNQAKEAAA
jgi:hypothetical protein